VHHPDAGSSEHFVNPFRTLGLLSVVAANAVGALLIGLDGVWDMHGGSSRGLVDVVGQECREDKWSILKV